MPDQRQLADALARLDVEVLRYAPPSVREDELLRHIGAVLSLTAEFRAVFPALKHALKGTPRVTIAQAVSIIGAAEIMDYFCGRLEEHCAPVLAGRQCQPVDSLTKSSQG